MTPVATARRIGAGARKPANWMQLFKFGLVGGSGYVINLAVFALAVEVFGVHHLTAALLAFCVAVTSNFHWNRHWTFAATDGHGASRPPASSRSASPRSGSTSRSCSC